MMTLKEAINHCYEAVECTDSEECKNEHQQLARWLEELEWFREKSIKLINKDYLGMIALTDPKYKMETVEDTYKLMRLICNIKTVGRNE